MSVSTTTWVSSGAAMLSSATSTPVPSKASMSRVLPRSPQRMNRPRVSGPAGSGRKKV
ncbi:MAG: hypothetical protein HC828_05565 [Blastochloris sp.]|nr:hypothetical protein [Blastochloris sp.]